ncbi:MAG: hypothetical protein D6678_06695 [Zetaproteobacteria bacterium]|nr:MAG: hypothetical protein D6678_06695 [Zetaproteobacteria bacterium]
MFRMLLIIVILVIAGWVGKNLHDGRPWYSNPFVSDQKAKALLHQAGDKAGKALGTGLAVVGAGGKKVAEGIEKTSEAAIKKGKSLKQ